MRRVLAGILAIVLVLATVSCNSGESRRKSQTDSKDSVENLVNTGVDKNEEDLSGVATNNTDSTEQKNQGGFDNVVGGNDQPGDGLDIQNGGSEQVTTDNDLEKWLEGMLGISDDKDSGNVTENVQSPKPEAVDGPKEKVTIDIYSYTDEISAMIRQYIDAHPDCGFDIRVTIIPTTDGLYQPSLDEALSYAGNEVYGSDRTPDIYMAEQAFVYKYTKGDMSSYAAAYKDLGIDVESEIKNADIARYAVEIGTRDSDGKLVALPYQSTGGVFIYRRSIAREVFGTDDPEAIQEIIGGNTGSWELFMDAAGMCKQSGYKMLSGVEDLWYPVGCSADKGWVVNGSLYIDSKREQFLDLAKEMYDNGWIDDTVQWSESWFENMKYSSSVFGFFGPTWLINYTIDPNSGSYDSDFYTLKGTYYDGIGSYGDWAVCNSPCSFYWGGSYMLVNKNASAEKRDALKKIVEWVTLDTTTDGLQYKWANGLYSSMGGVKDSVVSSTVLAKSDGRIDILSGQDMFEYIRMANKNAKGNNISMYDDNLRYMFIDQVKRYMYGECTRSEALEDFRNSVGDYYWFLQ